MNTLALQTHSAAETIEIGKQLATGLRLGDVIALVGQLGAGKTQLTRGIATGLGVNPRQVASPTFVLMTEYTGRIPVVHIDAYRVQSLGDLESIGFTPELLSESVTVIEWADRIAHDLPEDHLRIELSHIEDGRDILFIPAGRFRDRAISLEKPMKKRHICKVCGKPTGEDSPTFPFCSDRCKLVDLNRWFTGNYSVSRPLDEQKDEPELL